MGSAAYRLLQGVVRRRIFTSTVNIAFGANVTGAYFDVSMAQNIDVFKTSTAGTYQAQALWSDDGVTPFFTETLTVADGARNAQVACLGRYVAIKVSNTHGADNFTSHFTIAYAEGA